MYENFGGWYYRIHSDTDTLAIIPSYHKNGQHQFCEIQLITKEHSWQIPFSCENFRKDGNQIQIGSNHFNDNGIQLHLEKEGITAIGNLRFGPLTSLRYDIMGPFQYVPFMECRHTIRSMRHSVTGSLKLNQTTYCFENDLGYLEGDRGKSFPKYYVWTQCFLPKGSLVLSVAEIPMGLYRFTGIIAVVMWRGKEYRMATYLGAKVVFMKAGEIIIRQGKLVLSAKLLEDSGNPLLAPVHGKMVRTIRENVACHAEYYFQVNEKTVFQHESVCAAFEYEYPK